MVVMTKEKQSICYVVRGSAVLPEFLIIEPLLFSFPLPDSVGKTSSSTCFININLFLFQILQTDSEPMLVPPARRET